MTILSKQVDGLVTFHDTIRLVLYEYSCPCTVLQRTPTVCVHGPRPCRTAAGGTEWLSFLQALTVTHKYALCDMFGWDHNSRLDGLVEVQYVIITQIPSYEVCQQASGFSLGWTPHCYTKGSHPSVQMQTGALQPLQPSGIELVHQKLHQQLVSLLNNILCVLCQGLQRLAPEKENWRVLLAQQPSQQHSMNIHAICWHHNWSVLSGI